MIAKRSRAAGCGARGWHAAAAATASSLALVAALSACAQDPAAAPSTDRTDAHSHHTTDPTEEPASSAAFRPRSGAARDQALPRLRGTVGPGYTITISRNRVPAGRYRVVVTDSSSAHNWRIRGTGVNEHTSVSATGRWGWRVRLRAGAYSILCDPHPSTMRTTLRVTDD